MVITTSTPIIAGYEPYEYTDLYSDFVDWMARSDCDTARAIKCVSLAEQRLNRLIGAFEQDATLTGVVDQQYLDVDDIYVTEPMALFLDQTGGRQKELLKRPNSTIAYDTTSGEPCMWSWDHDQITFDRPLNSAYTFRLRYKQRFELGSGQPYNWLLLNHRDVYLGAAIMWGGAWVRDYPFTSMWSQVLETGIPEVKNQIARAKRGLLVVDPALRSHGVYNWQTDE